jgi:signal transduction histidine kinase
VCGEAADEMEAVRAIRERRPDVVLMDVSMPEMNGVEATRIIHQEFPDIRVLIVSQNDPEITKRQAQEAVTETRTMSYLPHPPLLDETGLGSAIRWYVDGFAKRSGIDVALLMPESVPRFSNEIETAMFRILQESLTNAHRHANTNRAQITLDVNQYTVALTVRDFGRGILPERLRSFWERNEGVGVGLGGMRERAQELGGSLTVAPAEDNVGTVVFVEIPIVARESGESDRNEHFSSEVAS